jgi:hypothetical protein
MTRVFCRIDPPEKPSLGMHRKNTSTASLVLKKLPVQALDFRCKGSGLNSKTP